MATRTIDIALALSGEKTFNDQMKAVNSNLSTLRSEMKLCSAEFKGNENSVAALTEKQRILTEQVEQQKEVVRALTEMQEKAAEAYGESSKEADQYRRQLNNAKASLVEMSRELDTTTGALDDTAKAEEQTADATQKLKDKLSSLGGTILDGALNFDKWAVSAGAAAAVAAGTVMVAGVKTLTEWATAAAESAKAAAETGEKLDWSKQMWLDYSRNLDNFTNRAQAAKNAMAMVLLPALNDLTVSGAKLLDEFAADMERAAGDPQRMGEVVSLYITRAAQAIQEQLPEILSLARNFLEGVNQGFSENSDAIVDAAGEVISMLCDFLIEAAPQLGETAGEIVLRLGTEIINHAPDLLEAGIEMMLSLLEGFIEGLPEFIARLPEIIGRIIMALLQAAPRFFQAGAQLINALWEGFVSMIAEVTEYIANWANSMTARINAVRANVIVDPNDPSFYAPRHATGLPTVPFDDYAAYLHRGEAVLTASQAARWRAGESVSGSTGGGGSPRTVRIEFVNEIDGMELSRRLYEYDLSVGSINGNDLTRAGGSA